MNLARPLPDPTPTSVAHDRYRIRYALVGAGALLAGIWIAWLAAWGLGWSVHDLGMQPRQPRGLIGIVTAPFAHASFAHLMSNTLPLGLLAALTLYCYPRARAHRAADDLAAVGARVWLFARDTVHVGASGIAHGLMFFLFVMGLLRRDRLAVVTSLVVFFLYGGMLLSVLPARTAHRASNTTLPVRSAGVLAALLLFARDPLPSAKRYSWEDEDDADPGA